MCCCGDRAARRFDRGGLVGAWRCRRGVCAPAAASVRERGCFRTGEYRPGSPRIQACGVVGRGTRPGNPPHRPGVLRGTCSTGPVWPGFPASARSLHRARARMRGTRDLHPGWRGNHPELQTHITVERARLRRGCLYLRGPTCGGAVSAVWCRPGPALRPRTLRVRCLPEEPAAIVRSVAGSQAAAPPVPPRTSGRGRCAPSLRPDLLPDRHFVPPRANNEEGNGETK